MKLLLQVVLLALGVTCQEAVQKFENYKLYKLFVVDTDQAAELHSWHKQGNLDFWSYGGINHSVTVMIHPGQKLRFEQTLELVQIESELVEENVQILLEEAHKKPELNETSKRMFLPEIDPIDFHHFWTLDEIYRYMDQLQKWFPKLVHVMEIGRTSENRPIKVICVSTKGYIDQTRPVILIDAGLHAREWASHMSTIHLMHQLVEKADENKELLENTDWIIMPVANPDGYVYSHEMNRLWRKNRYSGYEFCSGVDLNRNFPFRWSYTSHSCTDGYAGHAPGSEQETQALMLLMGHYARSIKVYLSVHSCGNYILYPYGYDYVPAPNAAALHLLGMQAAQAVKDIGGPEFEVGNSAELLYPASGSDDFIYGSYGVEYAYTLELSCGKRGFGFIIDTEQIESVSAEAFEMFKVFGQFAGNQTVATRS